MTRIEKLKTLSEDYELTGTLSKIVFCANLTTIGPHSMDAMARTDKSIYKCKLREYRLIELCHANLHDTILLEMPTYLIQVSLRKIPN